MLKIDNIRSARGTTFLISNGSLDKFFEIHDPTQVNRQGADIGENYRSAIFYHNESQKKSAEDKIAKLEKSKKYSRPIATKVEPAKDFYRAEEYHQQYLKKRNIGIKLF